MCNDKQTDGNDGKPVLTFFPTRCADHLLVSTKITLDDDDHGSSDYECDHYDGYDYSYHKGSAYYDDSIQDIPMPFFSVLTFS